MKRILYVLAISLIVFTGCKKEETTPTTGDSFETLTTYLVAQDLDLPVMITGWITARPEAEDLTTFLDAYDILDIRGAEDFGKGHIDGATNTTLGNILTAASSATKPILVVCYTGQTASHAVIALRLSGHLDAKVLKWGMSGWAASFSGPWLANSGADNGNTASSNPGSWTAAPGNTTTTGSFDYPSYTTSATDGSGILKEQVDKMLEGGFKGIANTDVLSSPSSHFVNNFWDTENVEMYGNISGSYRIKPLGIESGAIKGLDPSKTIVTYCWTGQTSSMITAYLNVIGYKTVSLKFGANGMIYDDLHTHQFVTPATDLPVVTD